MSPVVIDRIKEAEDVQIVEEAGQFSIKAKINGAWVTLLTNDNRSLCEEIVRKASSKVILG